MAADLHSWVTVSEEVAQHPALLEKALTEGFCRAAGHHFFNRKRKVHVLTEVGGDGAILLGAYSDHGSAERERQRWLASPVGAARSYEITEAEIDGSVHG